MGKKSGGKNAAADAATEVCFEEALGKLEVIVRELERGDLPLKEALARFAAGVGLSQICLERLNSAERTIDKILREEKGQLIELPLELREEDKC